MQSGNQTEEPDVEAGSCRDVSESLTSDNLTSHSSVGGHHASQHLSQRPAGGW